MSGIGVPSYRRTQCFWEKVAPTGVCRESEFPPTKELNGSTLTLILYAYIRYHRVTTDTKISFFAEETPLVKAPKPKGLGLCFIAVRLPRKVLRLLHRGTQAAPQDVDSGVYVSIVVRPTFRTRPLPIVERQVFVVIPTIATRF